jgi:hypothetical protein
MRNFWSADEVKVKQRTVLWFLAFSGFAVNYMIRININIALIDMLDSSYKQDLSVTPECTDAAVNVTKNGSRVEEYNGGKQNHSLSLERNLLNFLSVMSDRHCERMTQSSE